MIIQLSDLIEKLERRQEMIKDRLCNPGLDEKTTQLERGRYAELRTLLSDLTNEAAQQ